MLEEDDVEVEDPTVPDGTLMGPLQHPGTFTGLMAGLTLYLDIEKRSSKALKTARASSVPPSPAR